jgi:aryl-alcohol dehydrogenase-like predicted oxidoreductase
MDTTRLGGSELEVSVLCLGCMNFGTRVDEAASLRLLDQYYEAGGRFLDTANNYAFWNTGTRGGESEAVLARWLAARGRRDDVVLATKVGARPTVAGGDFSSAEGLGAKAITEGLDGSLDRLGVEHVDLLYAHIDDRDAPLEETLEALDGLVRAGKVRQIGASNYEADRLSRAWQISVDNGWAAYRCLQQRHSYLRPNADADFGVQRIVDDELLRMATERDDFTLLAYSPLLGGAYSDPAKSFQPEYQRPGIDAQLAALSEVAADIGITVNQTVISWMLSGPASIIPVIAASRPEQLAENLEAADRRLGADALRRLNQARG